MRKRAEEYPFYNLGGPIAIAHRGGNSVGPLSENTLDAFWSACQKGITYAELDVCGTSDDEAVVVHGTRSPFATGRGNNISRGWVARHTYGELIDRPGLENVPLFRSVLRELLEMNFYVDIKTASAVGPTVRAIREAKARDRVSIGGSSHKYVKAAADMLGGPAKICTSVDGTGRLFLRTSSNLGPSFLESSGATSFHLPEQYLADEQVERLHEQGVHVIVWPGREKGTDSKEYIERSLGRGVFGVISDHTGLLREVFVNRGHTSSIQTPLGAVAIEGSKAHSELTFLTAYGKIL